MNEEIKNFRSLKEAFEKNADKTMESMYLQFRVDFVQFARKFNSNEDDIIDSFQDAIIALHHNLMWDKITEDKSSVKTYLFSIGKYKLINRVKKASKVVSLNESIVSNNNRSTYEEKNGPNELLETSISKLGSTCRKLLEYFYYRRYSIEAIQIQLGMKNENSVKANKSRCVKQLKVIMLKLKSTQDEF